MSRPKLRIERVSGAAWWQFICRFIRAHHRHHAPPQGWKFGLVVWRGPRIVAVATIGRPVARGLAGTLEVTRVCSLPSGASWGACSLIYRTSAELGATVTYTLTNEGGTSLVAAGWVAVGKCRAKAWRIGGRARAQTMMPWEKEETPADRVRWAPQK